MGLSFLKQIFKGSRCGCKKYNNKNKRSTRKRKSRKNYRGGYKPAKSQKNSPIRLSNLSKKKI